MYGGISILKYIDYCIGAFEQILIFISFLLRNSTSYSIIYGCGSFSFLSDWLFLSVSCCLHQLIYYRSAMNELFNIISRINTRCPGMSCNIVWYVLHSEKLVAASIPAQGSSLSR